MTNRSVENTKFTEYIVCACGCGLIISKYSKWGYERKYSIGHNDNKLRGTHLAEEHRKKISQSMKGENNHMWVGNKIKKTGLHMWVRRWLPKPKFCQMCKLVEPYDLANISGNYTRDLTDWEWLCRKCHMTKDGRRAIFLSHRRSFPVKKL